MNKKKKKKAEDLKQIIVSLLQTVWTGVGLGWSPVGSKAGAQSSEGNHSEGGE